MGSALAGDSSTNDAGPLGVPIAALMTADELLALSVPDKRTELVRGVLVVREPAGYALGRVAMNLAVSVL